MEFFKNFFKRKDDFDTTVPDAVSSEIVEEVKTEVVVKTPEKKKIKRVSNTSKVKKTRTVSNVKNPGGFGSETSTG